MATEAGFGGLLALPFGATLLATHLSNGQEMTTDASGAPVPVSSDTGGQTVAPQPPRDPNHEKGDRGENMVADHLGLSKNTTRYQPNGFTFRVTPDFVDFDHGFIAEVKNHEQISMTPQLRGMLQLSRDKGVRFDLYVDIKTEILSKELQGLIRNGDIRLIRMEFNK
ncbi:MAG: hypothetical protein HGB35_09260 [Geobacteraceae bacterium]|nr:hypothetical protein [Geobacteraceae bacterium]